MTSFTDLVSSPKGRFDGIERPYTPEDVLRLRGSLPITHTLAERGANRLWQLLHDQPYINALGAVTGNQAMQMVRAGLKAIYLSGWQVAADANTAGAVAIGLLWGGAVGNLLDRLFAPPGFGRGHVTDFLAYGNLFIGNLADVILGVGVALGLLLYLSKPRAEG